VVEKPSLQINKPAFTMPEPKYADNIKQPIINKEISPQSCSDLQTAEDGKPLSGRRYATTFYFSAETTTRGFSS
jgi:hypothetical protein